MNTIMVISTIMTTGMVMLMLMVTLMGIATHQTRSGLRLRSLRR